MQSVKKRSEGSQTVNTEKQFFLIVILEHFIVDIHHHLFPVVAWAG